ncbi:MAG: hypothetical protein LBR86_01745 [Tannerella sp.]|jgi:hypothetical protein|nr:hypothetical protein [Tannerella sp.]
MIKNRTEISADWSKIEEDRIEESKNVFLSAIDIIDKKFGNGYAIEHPELIAGFMNSTSTAIHGTTVGKCLLAKGEIIDENRIN